MCRMINAVRPIRPDFTFLTGWDVVLVPMLLIGADGGTNATSGVVPELMRKLYDLTAASTAATRAPKAHDAAAPPDRAVRRDALLRRFPRRLPRGGRPARLRLRPRAASR